MSIAREVPLYIYTVWSIPLDFLFVDKKNPLFNFFAQLWIMYLHAYFETSGMKSNIANAVTQNGTIFPSLCTTFDQGPKSNGKDNHLIFLSPLFSFIFISRSLHQGDQIKYVLIKIKRRKLFYTHSHTLLSSSRCEWQQLSEGL